MANAEGYKMSMVLIGSFMLMGISGMVLMAVGKADVATLKEFFTGLGILAAMFGLPGIIQSWVVTRGTSPAPTPVEKKAIEVAKETEAAEEAASANKPREKTKTEWEQEIAFGSGDYLNRKPRL